MTHLNEKMLVKLLDDSPDAMLVIDCDGLIVLANRQAEVLFDYGHPSLVVADAEQLITLHHADLGSRRAGLLPAGRRRDGSTFQAEISLSTMDFDPGTLTTASIRDVTTRVTDRGHERARARRTRGQPTTTSREPPPSERAPNESASRPTSATDWAGKRSSRPEAQKPY